MSRHVPRRRVLASASGALLFGTGCLDRSATGGSADPSPNGTDEATADRSPTDGPDGRLSAEAYDCADAARPSPDPVEGAPIRPREYPDPPDSFEDGGREFLREYERAYLLNELLVRYGDDLSSVGSPSPSVSIEERGAGFLVATLEATFAYSGIDDEDQPWTADAADRAAYYVDDRAILREGSYEEDLTPREDGELLACFYDCSDPTRPEPDVDAADDEVGPAAYPDPLEDPANAADHELVAYVREYETAYLRNQTVANEGPLRRFEIGHASGAVDDRDASGAVVRCQYAYSHETDDVHADSPPIRVAYYVSDAGVFRTPHGGDEGLDPRESGRPLECFD